MLIEFDSRSDATGFEGNIMFGADPTASGNGDDTGFGVRLTGQLRGKIGGTSVGSAGDLNVVPGGFYAVVGKFDFSTTGPESITLWPTPPAPSARRHWARRSTPTPPKSGRASARTCLLTAATRPSSSSTKSASAPS